MPVWVFPAMNTHMYSHPFTAKQLRIVQEELGYEVHGPIEKLLACGDLGTSHSHDAQLWWTVDGSGLAVNSVRTQLTHCSLDSQGWELCSSGATLSNSLWTSTTST